LNIAIEYCFSARRVEFETGVNILHVLLKSQSKNNSHELISTILKNLLERVSSILITGIKDSFTSNNEDTKEEMVQKSISFFSLLKHILDRIRRDRHLDLYNHFHASQNILQLFSITFKLVRFKEQTQIIILQNKLAKRGYSLLRELVETYFGPCTDLVVSQNTLRLALSQLSSIIGLATSILEHKGETLWKGEMGLLKLCIELLSCTYTFMRFSITSGAFSETKSNLIESVFFLCFSYMTFFEKDIEELRFETYEMINLIERIHGPCVSKF